MSDITQRVAFEHFYAGTAPWDIGRPQSQSSRSRIGSVGPVLDAGCGTGENALFFAGQGHRVVGIDFVEEAIRRARVKASERGLSVQFLVKDAHGPGRPAPCFATAIDSGLFHALSDDDRRRYVGGLPAVLATGGRLFLLCRGDEDAVPTGRGGYRDRSYSTRSPTVGRLNPSGHPGSTRIRSLRASARSSAWLPRLLSDVFLF